MGGFEAPISCMDLEWAIVHPFGLGLKSGSRSMHPRYGLVSRTGSLGLHWTDCSTLMREVEGVANGVRGRVVVRIFGRVANGLPGRGVE